MTAATPSSRNAATPEFTRRRARAWTHKPATSGSSATAKSRASSSTSTRGRCRTRWEHGTRKRRLRRASRSGTGRALRREDGCLANRGLGQATGPTRVVLPYWSMRVLGRACQRTEMLAAIEAGLAELARQETVTLADLRYQLANADQTVRVVASRHRSIAYRTGPR